MREAVVSEKEGNGNGRGKGKEEGTVRGV